MDVSKRRLKGLDLGDSAKVLEKIVQLNKKRLKTKEFEEKIEIEKLSFGFREKKAGKNSENQRKFQRNQKYAGFFNY